MKLYTLKQAARLSGIHRVTLQRWISSGKAKPSYTVDLEDKVLYLFTPTAVKRLRRLKKKR
jgi:predicted site-specific integrase-resolvase